MRREREQQATAPVPADDPVVLKFKPTLRRLALNGVPALEIKPKGWRENKKILVYAHGGCYVFGTANSSLDAIVPLAHEVGIRAISIDYTTAPFAKWNDITDQIIKVVSTLVSQGYKMNDIALFGDSAGGGLVAAVTLKMRDKGMRLPAALLLWSPWTDVTETGDTYTTLKNEDPWYVYDLFSKPCANAYADARDQKHPYVSPVYGDFEKRFPPTLIQVGTKETFLSNSVRLYQKLDTGGNEVRLDVYEGMPHVFPRAYHLPEAESAIRKAGRFIRGKLNIWSKLPL